MSKRIDRVWSPGARKWVEVAIEDNVVPLKARKPAKPKSGGGLWTKTHLETLTDRVWDEFYPAKLRLLLWLKIQAFRGVHEIRLTNEIADELGLDRHQKVRGLSRLEELGLVTVKRSGKRVPLVKLAPE